MSESVFGPLDQGNTTFFNEAYLRPEDDKATVDVFNFHSTHRTEHFSFRELTRLSREQRNVYKKACVIGEKKSPKLAQDLDFLDQVSGISDDIENARMLFRGDYYKTEIARINHTYQTLQKQLHEEMKALTISYADLKKVPPRSPSPLWSSPFAYLGIAACGIASIVGAACFGGGLATLALATTSIFGFLKFFEQGKAIERSFNRTDELAVIKNTIADRHEKAIYLYAVTQQAASQPVKKSAQVWAGAKLQA